MHVLPRRQFLASSLSLGAAALSSTTLKSAFAAEPAKAEPAKAEPIIDIHQHTNYRDRTNAHLLHHQRAMGVTQTILLPAGSNVSRPSTASGKHNGLGGAKAGGNESCLETAKQHAGEFFFGANE